MTTINTAWCGDCNRIGIDHTHSCPQRTSKQLRLRDLCDDIAEHDDINTFHWRCIFNDGVDCEYEYLNDDGTIYAVELLRDHDTATETYTITVKRNLRDADGDRTREWFIESVSTMNHVDPTLTTNQGATS